MSFYRETPIKAVRKRHVCEGCTKWIEPGEAGPRQGIDQRHLRHPGSG